MRIAINTRFLLSKKMEGFGWYTYEVVKRIVENHPEHEFFLLFDRKYDEQFVFASNAKAIVLFPQARHPFLFFLWFEYSIKKALKKYKIDLFFSPDGYLSLGSSIKQIPVIHDINFEHNPQDLKPVMRKYLLRFFPKFAKKASHIITVSTHSKNDISKTYQIPEEKITAIWNGASEVFNPIGSVEREKVRIKYAKGSPYFLFVGALHPRKNVKRLIQAFTLFKKRHADSNHQLIIVGEELWNKANAGLEIDAYVKSHIHFSGHLPLQDLAMLMAGAEIFTYVPYFEGFGIPLVEAMRCGTPILAGSKTSLPEVAGDAAVYCDPFDVEDIANKLTDLAFNDNLKLELSEKGLKRSKLFSWDITAQRVWEVIEKELN